VVGSNWWNCSRCSILKRGELGLFEHFTQYRCVNLYLKSPFFNTVPHIFELSTSQLAMRKAGSNAITLPYWFLLLSSWLVVVFRSNILSNGALNGINACFDGRRMMLSCASYPASYISRILEKSRCNEVTSLQTRVIGRNLSILFGFVVALYIKINVLSIISIPGIPNSDLLRNCSPNSRLTSRWRFHVRAEVVASPFFSMR